MDSIRNAAYYPNMSNKSGINSKSIHLTRRSASKRHRRQKHQDQPLRRYQYRRSGCFNTSKVSPPIPSMSCYSSSCPSFHRLVLIVIALVSCCDSFAFLFPSTNTWFCEAFHAVPTSVVKFSKSSLFRDHMSVQQLSQQKETNHRRRSLSVGGKSQPEENKEEESEQQLSETSFGDVVPLRRRSNSQQQETDAEFGDVVPLRRPSSKEAGEDMIMSSSTTKATQQSKQKNEEDTGSSTEDEFSVQQKIRRARNVGVAIASILLAVGQYTWQYNHPTSPIQLLSQMEQQHNMYGVSSIGTNSKPTVIDFWAPWCEQCKQMAPTMFNLEQEYDSKVNFVMVNGDSREALPLIEAFGVDAIPHIALISAEGDVETALIGLIPKYMLEDDIKVLLSNAAQSQKQPPSAEQQEPTKEELPYQMLDVFANKPRRIRFVMTEE